jgi:hypothetical protein
MGVVTVFLGMIGVGGLCYPRRPRATGAIFMAVGAAVCTAWAAGAIGGVRGNILFASGNWLTCGAWILWKFRAPATRRAHVAAWTARSG